SDPTLREVGSSQVVSFTVAVSDSYRKADGEYADSTQFIDCEAWDSAAKSIANNWYKGDPVLVEGKLRKDVWEKDGTKHSRQKVRVLNFKKFARYSKSEEPEVPVGNGEEIPF